MGVISSWQDDFLRSVKDFYPKAQIFFHQSYFLVNCEPNLYVHLVSLHNNFQPNELIQLQESYQTNGLLLVHLWEDVWKAKKQQVLGRIFSFLHLNKGLHGRKAKIQTLNPKQAAQFMASFHLQGEVRSKYHYGLAVDNELICAACFSAPRPMKHISAGYESAELIRFASIPGKTVVGGLSKLIKHFAKEVKFNDLMTYADRDWSIGKGYERLGFTLSETTTPSVLYADNRSLVRYFPHRLPKELIMRFEAQKNLNLEEFLVGNGYLKVFNTGNLKFHLYL